MNNLSHAWKLFTPKDSCFMFTLFGLSMSSVTIYELKKYEFTTNDLSFWSMSDLLAHLLSLPNVSFLLILIICFHKLKFSIINYIFSELLILIL